MHDSDNVIRLDTGAFRAARAVRATRSLAYWVVLVVLAAGVAVGIAVIATTLGREPSSLGTSSQPLPGPAAPPRTETGVTVWNATSVDGAANRLKIRLAKLGYPADAGKSHGLPKGGLKGTWVFYAPGAEAAARGVAADLGVNAKLRLRPLDGIRPDELAPSSVLVVIGR